MNVYDVEYTDTFGGEANYCWVKRETVSMPELTYYGYDGGSNYTKANNVFKRELMKRAKSVMGLTGVRGKTEDYGISAKPSSSIDSISFKPVT